MRIGISGIGIWGRGMRNWPEFCALVNTGDDGAAAQWQAPAPAAIPARERRHSPLMVKLAVEVACQACDMAGLDRRDVATVFGSSMGDGEISDYLCRALASESKVLSPTRFHNSVHNAPAGYWSISAATARSTPKVATARRRAVAPSWRRSRAAPSSARISSGSVCGRASTFETTGIRGGRISMLFRASASFSTAGCMIGV